MSIWDVLAAARTKWNFLHFEPGLVGGHCIGVDPYYLTHKAEMVGHLPEIILAGRRLNDAMGKYVAEQMVKALLKRRIHVNGARILMLGLTFKENCPDLRNTRVTDVIDELREFGAIVDVYDPWVHAGEAMAELGYHPIEEPEAGNYDGIILAVAHDHFRDRGSPWVRTFGKPNHIFYDLKSVFRADQSDMRL